MNELALTSGLATWAHKLMGLAEHHYSSLLVEQNEIAAVLFQLRFPYEVSEETSIDVSTEERGKGEFSISTLKDLSGFLRHEHKRIFYVLGKTVIAGVVREIKYDSQYKTYTLEGNCIAIPVGERGGSS